LNISRADQDAFAWRSQQRTAQAQRDGILAQEIAPYQRQAELFDTTIGWRFCEPAPWRQHFGTDSMPETAENVAELLNISRADQDAFAWR
ncbi:hypothetical protein C7D74_32035, partial [Klebsiella pneumoniae]